MKRRIKRADIRFISLCPRGKNQMPVIYKSDGTVQFDTLIKATEDAGEITAVVYAPEVRDSDGDIASAEVIKEMAYGYAMRKGSVDIIHDGKAVTPDRAFTAENFLIQKGDDRFKDWKDYSGNPVDVTGGWAVVIKVNDAALRADYKAGKWNGVSMGGTGEIEVEKADDSSFVHKIIKGLADLIAGKPGTSTPPGDDDMNEQELKKHLETFETGLIAKMTTIVGTAVTTAVSAAADAALAKDAGVVDGDSPELRSAKITVHKANLAKGTASNGGTTTATPAAPANSTQAPVFKGEPTDAAAVAQFEYDTAVYNIKKDMKPNDPASVKAAGEAIAKLTKPGNPADQTAMEKAAGIKQGDSDEVKRLKLDLHKAEQRSNQGTPSGPGNGALQGDPVAKAEVELGARIAKAANAMNGVTDTNAKQ